MFDGKILRELAGIPIRRIDLEQGIGARRPRPVHIGEFYDEVVDALDRTDIEIRL
jgi:hypothetical protein